MGISAIIGGVSAVAGIANTVSGLAGGGSSSALGTVAGSGVSAAGQLEAGDIQAKAAEDALAAQKATTAKTLGAFDPFLGVSQGAETGLTNLLGFGPQGTAGELAALKATPGYQFALQQGLEGVTAQASGQGLGRSGAQMKGAAQYAEGLAGTTYQNMVQNFITTGNQALSATGGYVSVAQSAQNTENALMLARGQAKASGLVGAANTVGGGLAGSAAQLAGQPLNSSTVPNSLFPNSPTSNTNPYQPEVLPSWYTPTTQVTAPGAIQQPNYSANDLLGMIPPVNLGSS